MTTNLIPIRFNTNRNVLTNILENNNEVINIENDDIKSKIEHLLFVEKFNNVLVKFNNELFVCEPISIIKKSYNRRKVEYHPLMDKLN
jgi:hypothetical protein